MTNPTVSKMSVLRGAPHLPLLHTLPVEVDDADHQQKTHLELMVRWPDGFIDLASHPRESLLVEWEQNGTPKQNLLTQ